MSSETPNAYKIACLEVAIEHSSAQNRIDTGHSIIDMMETSNITDEERQALSKLLLKLTVDPIKTVRQEMAIALADLPDLSEDLVFSIIADDDELALPFLATTRSLNPQMMSAIVKIGDANRKLVIAARGDCHTEAVGILIRQGDVDILTELLENHSVVLSEGQYEKIIELLGDDPAIAQLLNRRRDMPIRLKARLVRAACENMRAAIPTSDVSLTIKSQRTVETAEEEAILQIAASADSTDCSALVSYLCDQQQLTPSLILRAVCTGEMLLVETALALLSGLQPARIQNLIYAQNALSLRAVHSRARLPKVLFNPLRVATDVQKARRQIDASKSPDHFGKQMIEAILTRYESFEPEQRTKLLQFMQSHGSPVNRELASHLLAEKDAEIAIAQAA